MSKFPVRIAAYIGLIIFVSATRNNAQSIEPEAHPNHYILLIDASGSTKQGKVRREAYYQALTEIIPSRLYETGFGEAVPHFDPSYDVLTMLDFGIVSGGSSQAYALLRELDFSKELIHPIMIRELSVHRADLEARIVPRQYYQYTLLSWARRLALVASAAPSTDTINHSTYLIMAHDGLFNENSSPQVERDWIHTLNNPSFRATNDLIDALEKEYQFTNGRGEQRPAWSGRFPENNPQIFVDVYKALSAKQASWEDEIARQYPWNQLKLRWTKERGNTPEGVLYGILSKGFLDYTDPAQNSVTSLTLVDGTNIGATKWKSNTSLEQQVSVSSPVSCDQKKYETLLKIPITQADRLLGTRIVFYVYQGSVTAPPAFRCTLGFILFVTGMGFAVAAVLSAISYAAYYRLFATSIEIRLPGSGTPIRIKRSGHIQQATAVSPKKELEAFSLNLPSRGLQRLLYRRAVLKLDTKKGGEAVLMNDSGSGSTLRFPSESDTVIASWKEIPAEPTELVVTFKQGRRSGMVSLSYPRGVS